MGMSEEQAAILAQLKEASAELEKATERLRGRRDELILMAVLAKIERTAIAEAAKLSEPMVYKIRRDEMEKQQKRNEE